MKITILTLFPEMFKPFIGESIIKRAINNGICEVVVKDIRDYSNLKHNHVDDTPYGGGQGMVIRFDILHDALSDNVSDKSKVLLMTPQGKRYNQKMAEELALEEDIVILCGHYEGFDERILDYCDEEISIGDYVLTGGELAAMVISDSIIRLLKGATRDESHEDDSFSTGLLEYPQFTRPYEHLGKKVPDVLVNGNHEHIRKYRLYESLKKTYLRRPDLLEHYELSKEEALMLKDIKEKYKN